MTIAAMLLAPVLAVQTQPDPRVQQLLAKMRQLYANVAAYDDTGSIDIVLDQDGKRTTLISRTFETHFARPENFKFLQSEKTKDGKLDLACVWHPDRNYATWATISPHKAEHTHLAEALQMESAMTNGVDEIVPPLLSPTDSGKVGDKFWEGLAYMRQEAVNGVNCDVLESNPQPGQYWTFWLSTDRFELLAARHYIGNKVRATETDVIYKPNFGPSPRISDFMFAPTSEMAHYIPPPKPRVFHGAGPGGRDDSGSGGSKGGTTGGSKGGGG